jgi:hypothetical protein
MQDRIEKASEETLSKPMRVDNIIGFFMPVMLSRRPHPYKLFGGPDSNRDTTQRRAH